MRIGDCSGRLFYSSNLGRQVKGSITMFSVLVPLYD